MAHAFFLPVDCGLTILLKEQRRRTANTEGLWLLTTKTHVGRLFLFLHSGFVQNDLREVRRKRKRDFGKPERIHDDIRSCFELEFLPYDWIVRHIASKVQN